MKKTSTSTENDLANLAQHLHAAVDSLVRLLGGSAGGAEKLPGGGEAPASPRAGGWPWDEIIPVAQRILAKDPSRRWHSGEFSHAIRAAGVKLARVTGLHFGLLPRLRKLDAIVEDGAGGFTGRPDGGDAATPSKPTARAPKPKAKAVVAKPAPGRGNAARPKTPAKPAAKAAKPATKPAPAPARGRAAAGDPIDRLVAATRDILAANPSKIWRPGELIAALRESGVRLPSWKGVHFQLLPRLKEAKLIDKIGSGYRARKA
jgi:hypothetical protein